LLYKGIPDRWMPEEELLETFVPDACFHRGS
jgi:hypothetical protein